MQRVVVILLVIITLILFWLWQKRKITNDTLNALAGIFTIIAGVAAIIVFVIPQATPNPVETSTPQIIFTKTNSANIPPNTLFLTNTPLSTEMPLPTYTPIPTEIPSTETPIPSPIPIISLPFTDNFSDGSNPAWNFAVGEWFVKDNSLSTLPIANTYEWAFLDDQNLRDYQIRVSVSIPNMYSGNDADARIIFRHDPSRAKQLIMLVDWWGNVYIGMLDNIQQRIPTALSDNRAFSVSSENFTMTIQVKGDTFTAFLDGQQVGTVAIKGFENGGVGLGVTCFYTCPSFKNFSLKPLP